MVSTNKEELYLDLCDLVYLFQVPDSVNIEHEEVETPGHILNIFLLQRDECRQEYRFEYDFEIGLTALQKKSLRKRQVKVHLYDVLSAFLHRTLPWGSLTGVRPTKFARDLVESGQVKDFLLAEVLERDYRLSREKAKLTTTILKNQKCIIRNDNLIDLYINIPICPSRCLYCSFISNEIDRIKDKVDTYIDCLLKELEAVKQIIAQKAYIVRTIYIGGGTPSVLSASQLERLLENVHFPVNEFTVECGRPDTITEEKLQVLRKYGVTRMSVNPQTFSQTTLKRIGRKHKNVQVFEAYQQAMALGFQVNMDVIAGLPGERFSTFKKTMTTLLELAPENITVHTLSVKNGALLRDEKDILSEKEVPKMIDYAEKILQEHGYKPYYLYRQKNQLAGLENVGFFRDDHVCIFNIDSMEETNTVIALGAGAMSKRVFNVEKRIERLSNVKFIEEYIARIDEMIEKKRAFYR